MYEEFEWREMGIRGRVNSPLACVFVVVVGCYCIIGDDVGNAGSEGRRIGAIFGISTAGLITLL